MKKAGKNDSVKTSSLQLNLSKSFKQMIMNKGI